MNKRTIKYQNFKIHYFNYTTLIKILSNRIVSNRKISISYLNPFVFNLLNNNLLYANMQKINLIYPDGIGMYYLAKLLGIKVTYKNRINATDFNTLLIESAAKYRWGISLYGGGRESIGLLKSNISVNYKGLIINEIFDRFEDANEVIKKINISDSKILFVGLGTPTQEEFIVKNRDLIKTPVIIGVGSFFEFLSGYYKRAPLWMRKIGLEWLFRLIIEPRRLWKRYIIGIPLFIFRIIALKLKTNEKL